MTISENLINHLMYNTLTVGVFGMIESKKRIGRENANIDDDCIEEGGYESSALKLRAAGLDKKEVQRIKDLERENKRLKAMLD